MLIGLILTILNLFIMSIGLNKIIAVILAGGKGTRFGDATLNTPKPLIGIGGKPIIWHIMKMYSAYGINDFIICSGYLQNELKKYFRDMHLDSGNLYINNATGRYEYTPSITSEPWNINVIDTGLDTETGGRLKLIKNLVSNLPYFCMTYGDSLTNVNIQKSIKYHIDSRTLATVSVHKPSSRFGELEVSDRLVTQFHEKPQNSMANINAGFYVLDPAALDLIGDDPYCVWEREPMVNLARIGQLAAYQYEGFWHPMDSEGDRIMLNQLWASGNAPWKVW